MRILIVRNNSNTRAVDASLLLATYLATQGVDYVLVDSSELTWRCDHEQVNAALSAGVEMAVVLGGDGTILRTARQIGTTGVPILGINFGRLGFLANTSDDGVVAVVAAALAGDVTEDRRTNLCINVICEGDLDPWGEGEVLAENIPAPSCHPGGIAQPDGEESLAVSAGRTFAPRTFFALNELAVTRGADGRIIDFGVTISGAHIADMRGDGLVVATATGSTAYALSAGGPLVAPSHNGLVVVPLAPHTLHSRAIVTAVSDVVEMDLPTNGDSCEATLFADGGEALEFDRPVRHIYVRRGEAPTVLLRYQREGFYEHAARVFF